MKKSAMLLPEEEQRLARKWRDEGDLLAREQFVTAFRPMVQRMARQMSKSGADFEDLESEGMNGLLIALDQFDPDANNRFSSFAFWKVLYRLQALTAQSVNIVSIQKTAAVRKAMRMLLRARKELPGDGIGDQVLQRISEESNVPLRDVHFLWIALTSQGSSLNTPLSHEGEAGALIDILADNDSASALSEQIERQQSSIILDALGSLKDPRGAHILSEKYLSASEASTADLAKKYGLTTCRIRQIEKKALEEMRAWMKARGFGANSLLPDIA